MIRAWPIVRCTSVLLALVSAGHSAAAAEPLDEHMILVLPTVIVTFDRSTVRFADHTRSVRTHLYLPAPDDDGHVSFQSTQEIDCAAKRSRYTDATGLRADGKIDAVKAEKNGFEPIVTDSPIGVLRDHVCAIEDKPNYPSGGVMLEVPGAIAARAAFALVKLGLAPEQAAQLSGKDYGDQNALTYNLDAQEIEQSRRGAVIDALGPLVEEGAKPPPPIIPQDSAVRSGRVGQYIHAEMELGARMWLKADGTFEYGLTVGSLDETARGTWSATGDRITLSGPVSPVRRGDADVSHWRVTCDGRMLTVVRDLQRMVFARHGS